MDIRKKYVIVIFFVCILIFFFFQAGYCRFIPGFARIGEKINRLELLLYDSHMNMRPAFPASDKIVLITIDEKSEEKLGSFPWKRGIHARLVDNLSKAGTALIVFDVGFIGETDSAEDEALAESCGKARNVVGAAYLKMNEEGNPVAVYPYDSLRKNLVACGFPEVNRDQDQVIRKIQIINKNFSALDPLFLAAVKNYLPLDSKLTRITPGGGFLQLGTRQIPLEAEDNMLINFSGSPYRRVSYGDVLDGAVKDIDFKDKIVVIMSVVDTRDQFRTARLFPIKGGRSRNLFGGEIHASAIQTVLDNRYIYHIPDLAVWVLGAILCLIWIVALFKVGYLKGLTIFAVQLAAYFYLCRFLFMRINLWVNFAFPAFMLIFCWLAVSLYEHKRLKEIFAQFLPKQAVEKMMTATEESSIGGKDVECTVLFADIRGYTNLSENMTPQEVMNFLNQYHRAISEVIEANHGTVMDYAGDSILVAFGATENLKDHVLWAAKAAHSMQKKIEKMNEINKDKPPVRVGVGICTGTVSCGVMGMESHKKYTVIGDVVNTASRLQGFSDVLKADIIISEKVKEILGEEFAVRDLGEVPVKGKSAPVRVFALQAKSNGT